MRRYFCGTFTEKERQTKREGRGGRKRESEMGRRERERRREIVAGGRGRS